jgi:hypothetical protein
MLTDFGKQFVNACIEGTKPALTKMTDSLSATLKRLHALTDLWDHRHDAPRRCRTRRVTTRIMQIIPRTIAAALWCASLAMKAVCAVK